MSQSASPSVSGVSSAIETFSPSATYSYMASFSPSTLPSYTAIFSPSSIPSYNKVPSFSASPTPLYAPTIIVQESVITIKTEYVYAFAVGIFTVIIILLMKIYELRKVRKTPFTASAPVEPSKIVVNPINSV